jgi:hypothetical protein
VIYLTYAANPLPSAAIVVRTSLGAGVLAGALRDVLRVIDPDLPLAGSVVPLDEAIDQELGLLTVFASMIGLFALAAMSLAMVGVYGVTAYAVTRGRENWACGWRSGRAPGTSGGSSRAGRPSSCSRVSAWGSWAR